MVIELGPLLLSDASSPKIRCHFFGCRAQSISPFWRFGLEWVHESFDFYPPKLPLLKQRHWWCLDHFLLPGNELLLPTNFRVRKPTFFFFVVMSKKKGIIHAPAWCSRTLFLTWRCSAMRSFHTYFLLVVNSNVWNIVCPSVYTDDLVFTRKIYSLLRLAIYTVELTVSDELIALDV